MTQKEEENREMYIRKSNQRLKEIVTQTQKVEKELAVAEGIKKEETEKRAAVIRELKTQLANIEKNAEAMAQKTNSDADQVFHQKIFSNIYFFCRNELMKIEMPNSAKRL